MICWRNMKILLIGMSIFALLVISIIFMANQSQSPVEIEYVSQAQEISEKIIELNAALSRAKEDEDQIGSLENELIELTSTYQEFVQSLSETEDFYSQALDFEHSLLKVSETIEFYSQVQKTQMEREESRSNLISSLAGSIEALSIHLDSVNHQLDTETIKSLQQLISRSFVAKNELDFMVNIQNLDRIAVKRSEFDRHRRFIDKKISKEIKSHSSLTSQTIKLMADLKEAMNACSSIYIIHLAILENEKKISNHDVELKRQVKAFSDKL